MRYFALLAAASMVAIVPQAAMAQEQIERVIGGVTRNAEGELVVELRFLNISETPAHTVIPDRIAASVEQNATTSTVWLKRAPTTPAVINIAAGSFAQLRYLAPAGSLADDAALTIPAWKTQQIVVAVPATQLATGPAEVPAPAAEVASAEPSAAVPTAESAIATATPAPPPTERAAGNAFSDNIMPYEPIYAVYAPGTNSDARIQISFKYRLFGSRAKADLPSSWREGLHFAYTQRMFWDLGAKSAPFRNIDFQPEVIYITPASTLKSGASIALQGGLRHESNGRDGLDSRNVNSIYAAPMMSWPLMDGYRLTVSPRLSLYVGSKAGNPDIVDYRGNTGLNVELGKDDGLRLSYFGRYNFDTGKGAFSMDASYPLPSFWKGGPDLYLFVQGYSGYGENLLDYNRSVQRLRAGFAFVR